MDIAIDYEGVIAKFQAQKKPLVSDLILHQSMVPKVGLEPTCISTVDFESTASTDFATSALKRMRKTLAIIPLRAECATLIDKAVR